MASLARRSVGFDQFPFEVLLLMTIVLGLNERQKTWSSWLVGWATRAVPWLWV